LATMQDPNHDPNTDSSKGTLVKRPGDPDSAWVLQSTAKGHDTMKFVPPPGQTGSAIPVIPGVNGAPN
jgi:hypothetical protein